MSKVVSFHNLSILEQLNNDLRKYSFNLHLILFAFDDVISSGFTNELNSLLWDCMETIEHLSHDFCLFEDCVRKGNDMNSD